VCSQPYLESLDLPSKHFFNDKHSSLFCRIVGEREKKFYKMAAGVSSKPYGVAEVHFKDKQ
jgi:hypothetical protein